MTDSGGYFLHTIITSPRQLTRNRFQMVSLLKLAQVTEEGVRFLSPHDGTPMYAS